MFKLINIFAFYLNKLILRVRKMNVNSIIEAAKAKGNGRIYKLMGYIGQGSPGKIELYLSLNMETCFELDEQDVIYFVEADKPTEPSMVFIHDQAKVVMRQEVKASSAATISSSNPISGVSEENGTSFLAARRRPRGTTGSPELDCLIQRLGCQIKCDTKYENDPLMQQACNDSCDAGYNICRYVGGVGGGSVIL